MRRREISLGGLFLFVAVSCGCGRSKKSLVNRFMASVPSRDFISERECRNRDKTWVRITMARDWKGNVRQSDSLTNPIVGELSFRLQMSDQQSYRGWSLEPNDNLIHTAVYHVVDGKWALQDVKCQCSDVLAKQFSMAERLRLAAELDEIMLLLPNNF